MSSPLPKCFLRSNDNDVSLVERVFQPYVGDANVASVGVRTKEVLLDSLKRGTGATSCLICISGIKKTDPIWNCGSCFCSFHLNCIQRWARDSVFQQKNEIANFDCEFQLWRHEKGSTLKSPNKKLTTCRRLRDLDG